MTLPRWMYGDPMRAAMRAESRSCSGCRDLERLFGREVCTRGRKNLIKCRFFNKGEVCTEAPSMP